MSLFSPVERGVKGAVAAAGEAANAVADIAASGTAAAANAAQSVVAAAGDASVAAAIAAFDAVKMSFDLLAAGAAVLVCPVLDTARAAIDVVRENTLRSAMEPTPHDGEFMGADCQFSKGEPAIGVLPAGCAPGCGKPKVYFTNGIKNTAADLCKTLNAIANERCVEIVGIYNSTYQKTLGDVQDCLASINLSGDSAAAKTMSDMLIKELENGSSDPIEILAHSEGGLNTQSALREAAKAMRSRELARLMGSGEKLDSAIVKADSLVEQKLSRVTIRSFGTARDGWIDGPRYIQYENSVDLVPKAISAAQNILFTNAVSTDPLSRYVDYRGLAGAMPGHGMVDTYLPFLSEMEPVAKNADGTCC